MDSKEHLETSLEKIRPLFEKARARIDALLPGEKIPATKLADDIAKEIGSTGPAIYPILKMLFDGYPGVSVKRGAHGGITCLPLDKTDPKKDDTVQTNTVSDTE